MQQINIKKKKLKQIWEIISETAFGWKYMDQCVIKCIAALNGYTQKKNKQNKRKN